MDIRGRAAELTGRSSECDVLDGLIEAVREGESRALVVGGEPELGNTALRHRIFPRSPDGESLDEPLIVSIDLSEIAFS